LAHEVFISYASPDKKAADAVCGTLEQRGIRCCIFPRDGIPGKSFAETIAEYMGQCRVMVLVLSSHANSSKHISREVEMAVRRGLTVIPFRIEAVQPTGSLEYWIAEAHWLDAITPEMERGLNQLEEWVRPHVAVVERSATAAAGSGRAAERPAGDPPPAKRVRPAFCRKCGSRLLPEARFCRQCGTSVPR